MSQLEFTLKPLAPFRLDLTVWSLRRRPDNLVDRWDGRTYRRVLVLDGKPAEVAVTQTAGLEAPRLAVTASGPRLAATAQAQATGALERLLGLRIDLDEFYRFAKREPKLHPLVERFRGTKPPRFPSVFEALVNAIVCQQFTLTVGIRLLNRLCESFALAYSRDGTQAYAFVRPKDLASVTIRELRRMGFSRQKWLALTQLSQGILAGRIDLDALEGLDAEAAVARLQELRGVGRWTAEYALLRGLGWVNVFPGDDVGARNNLGHWLRKRSPLDYEGVRRALARWSTYAGLVYFHLLLDRLSQLGYVLPESTNS